MSFMANGSHLDWRKWMDADVTVSSSKWRNKCKSFWILFDKCLRTPDYWLGAAFLSGLFVKALIKSYGPTLQPPCKQQLCLWSEEFRDPRFGVRICGNHHLSARMATKGPLHKNSPWVSIYLHLGLLLTLCLLCCTKRHPEVKDKTWRQLWKRPVFFSALKFVLLTILSSYLIK